MKILITGGKGMLGRTLRQQWRDDELIIADLPECDITDAAACDRLLARTAPDAVVHCAAMTAVDRCESEIEAAFRINAVGSGNVAAACFRHGVRLIAISTDYVFNGTLARPYSEFDPADGGNTVYGRSKFAGEEAIRRHCPNHLIARIAWLYGAGGPSFVHTMMKLAREAHPVIRVVNDQHGNPTSTTAVARRLRDLLARPELTGTFHLSCEGETTWFGFAREIFALAGLPVTPVPCSSAEFPRPAPRPANSRLEKQMLRLHRLPPMPHWRDALREFLHEEFGVGLNRSDSH